MAAQDAAAGREPGLMTVVAASAAGTAFEWYDFFIFGNLATIIAKHFYSNVGPATGFILVLATFAVGFIVRPLGALVFGLFGDRKGRKGAFLVTITTMGLATVAIGLLPGYDQIGILAPIGMLLLRILQGFALGGEYGGAAIYVAEHAPNNRRGFLTGWIQTSAALGLVSALGMILLLRTLLGPAAFEDWGWRLPFVLSAVLLMISLWVRMKLGESPAFRRMEQESATRRAPFRETFLQWNNLKRVLLVLFAVMTAQGAVWYGAFFYSQFFMQKILKVDDGTVSAVIAVVTIVSAFLYVFFGWLSDKIGRKPVMLFGMFLGVVAFAPITNHSAFHYMTRLANPALAAAQAHAPVTVTADPAGCSLQFDPVGAEQFSSPCDIARSLLTNAGVTYENRTAAPGAPATVQIGSTVITPKDGRGLKAPALKALKAGADAELKAALKKAGYPTKADPAQVDFWGLILVMLVLTVAATAVYGPQAAALVEQFPTRVRYTGMGVPYNIGTGWVGGLLPVAAFAMMAASGNIYFGLWYPTLFTLSAFLVCLFLLPETKGRDLDSIKD
jgi:MFS family permease